MSMKEHSKASLTLWGFSVVLLTLGVAFLWDLWGASPVLPTIPEVDPAFAQPSALRMSGAELVRTGGDASGLDCYACHDRNKRSEVHFDEDHRIKLPEEHNDLVMAHGSHNRNNLCFNCHDDSNLDLLQTRDGRQLKLLESVALCGSCHGPTYRDWEAGVHGRTLGYWNVKVEGATATRAQCVSCHDPHAPKIPRIAPAPGPNPIRL